MSHELVLVGEGKTAAGALAMDLPTIGGGATPLADVSFALEREVARTCMFCGAPSALADWALGRLEAQPLPPARDAALTLAGARYGRIPRKLHRLRA